MKSGSCVVSKDGEIKLGVVSILVLVVLYATVCYDVANLAAVDGKQERSEHRSLMDANLEAHSW